MNTHMIHKDFRKFLFTIKVVGEWGDLDERVVEEGSIHSFKSRYVRAHEVKGSEAGKPQIEGLGSGLRLVPFNHI